MKILYFHQHFTLPTSAGGTRSYEFAQKLIEKGHQVTMVAGSRSDLGLAPTKKKGIYRGDVNGIDVIQIALPYSNRDSLLKRTATFLKFGWKSIKIAFNEDYDLLFATSTPLTAGLPGIVMKLFGKKKKFVFEVRDLWPELPKALGMKNPVFLTGMSILEWLSYHTADGCIGLSPGICKGIVKRSQNGKPIELVPNGCDLGLFQPSDGELSSADLPELPSDKKIAVFTGAHGVANGLDSIVDAAKILGDKRRNDILIVLIGDGKMKTHLQERVEKESIKNILFYNPIPKIKLAKIISRADVGLMVLANVPAFYYGTSPNKFFDYIASGLPVVNNYPGWLADMIKENKLGVVTEPGNAKALAEGIEYVIDNENLRNEFGHNARAFAEREFSRNDLGNKFERFLSEVYGS